MQVLNSGIKIAARGDEGQALVEYALVLLLIALVTVAALTSIGVSVSTAITNMANGL
jgi:pilus assembly protein Flp/PilA